MFSKISLMTVRKHPFFEIFGPTTNFWAGQEVGGTNQIFFDFKTLPWWWVTTAYNTKPYA